MSKLMIAWLFSLINAFAPAERMAAAPQLPGWEETVEQKVDRYNSIAEDLTTVVLDPSVTPLFQGKNGRERTAALILAVAYHEGGFAHDVDKGPCYKKPGEHQRRCDGGLASCLLQIHMGYGGKTREGWTPAEIFADRKKCFLSGLNAMRGSLGACRKNPKVEERLSAYAQGNCTNGVKQSKELWNLYQKFWSRMQPPPIVPETMEGVKVANAK